MIICEIFTIHAIFLLVNSTVMKFFGHLVAKMKRFLWNFALYPAREEKKGISPGRTQVFLPKLQTSELQAKRFPSNLNSTNFPYNVREI